MSFSKSECTDSPTVHPLSVVYVLVLLVLDSVFLFHVQFILGGVCCCFFVAVFCFFPCVCKRLCMYVLSCFSVGPEIIVMVSWT